ncbi:Cyanogenic beta-glucosidase, partial [Mucuna pruriens]
ENVGIMKDMNLDSYKISISWSRILPKGKLSGGINQGINYYHNLINELLANDIPQPLEDEYGGFLSPPTVRLDSGTEPYLVTRHQFLAHIVSDWLYVYPKRNLRPFAIYQGKVQMNLMTQHYECKNFLWIHFELIIIIVISLIFNLQLGNKGVNMKGYYVWSLFDNFGWSSGYTKRFGITFVDYKNGLKRYSKLSALWFKSFLKKNARLYDS